MAGLTLRRIRLAEPGGAAQLAGLRRELSAQGNVVSPRGRALTEKVFGEALPPARVVERICDDVRVRGREALFHYTEQFDRVTLDADSLRVSEAELAEAHAELPPALL